MIDFSYYPFRYLFCRIILLYSDEKREKKITNVLRHIENIDGDKLINRNKPKR